MPVKNFKFVSPGVFINEIDNSFIPKSAEAIGPVVIGRSTRGLAMQPVKVRSYSDFVEMFGETVPGGAGSDVYREGNFKSPMYGTYAAKAFLRANVAPLTYVRLLGQQTSAGSTAGGAASAGWKTANSINEIPISNGGAYGLWLFNSASNTERNLFTGSLAAIFYVDDGEIYLSGNVYGGGVVIKGGGADISATTGACNTPIGSDSNNLYTVVISGSAHMDKIKFGFDDSKDTFIRKRFNTNPQLVSSPGTFYPNLSARDYWLGETYEQELRDRGLTTASVGVMLAIQKGTAGPFDMESNASTEAKAGWFIGQDLGTSNNYAPFNAQRLFRFIGRGHGEWLHRNCKVSIEKIRHPTTTATDYGTFSVVIRNITDTDNNVQVMERYDNCNLDPTSPDFVARKIGDTYTSWNENEKRLKSYGEYPNQSKFIYVDMNGDVEAGATDPTLLPFGYFAPPRFRSVYNLKSTGACDLSPAGNKNEPQTTQTALTNFFLTGGTDVTAAGGGVKGGNTGWAYGNWNARDVYLSGGMHMSTDDGGSGLCTGSFVFPTVRLRNSASDGGLSDPTDAYFGMQTTRTAAGTTPDASIADFHRLLYSGYSAGGGTNPGNEFATAGVEDYAYVFSLDNVVLKTAGGSDWYYASGSRRRGDSYTSSSYEDLLNSGIDRFTAPFWGGFDGFNITKPDPLRNGEMSSTSTEDSSYVYHTWRRGIDTVADPEFVDMNLLTTPGLTLDNLTVHAVNVCEDRADSMALVDLKNIYIPPHEQFYSDKASRIGTTPTTAANDLKDRRLDSSYGACFYPWVQTRDEMTGRLLWVPPSVVMMGVLASSQAKSELWFAPAGFNRGGLTEGAAGIPVTNVSERVISKDRDVLYDANINPIASFPSSGIVVFGQKTLQQRQSALDRINVRRLVIFLKKQISILSTKILFEQNVQATWNRFIGLVDPLLSNVKARYGITDYRLVLDESTTTPDLIDQNILYAKIMVKPARAIEFIAIDFVIMSTGASFDD